MNLSLARELLTREIQSLRAKPYSFFLAMLDKPQTVETIGSDRKHYQIEIQALWDSKKTKNTRVICSIDDGALRSLKPLSEDFIIWPTGDFVDES